MIQNNTNANGKLNDESYPKHHEFNSLRDRTLKISGEIVEKVNLNDIAYYVRDMEFAKLVPNNDYVEVIVQLPYDRIIDLSHKCEVDYFNGENRSDIVSFKVYDKINIQYGVSIIKQSFIYRKRLKL